MPLFFRLLSLSRTASPKTRFQNGQRLVYLKARLRFSSGKECPQQQKTPTPSLCLFPHNYFFLVIVRYLHAMCRYLGFA